MTLSETLRAMLKERGIEYETRDALGACETSWCGYTAYQLTPESKLIMHPTPEQAIAATVGNGTDLSKRLRKVTGLRSFAELFGFSWEDESDWDWHDVACAMADAIDATVGVGTCKDLGGVGADDEVVFNCSECGCVLSVFDKDGTNNLCTSFIYDYPRFCPECGRRIEEETE